MPEGNFFHPMTSQQNGRWYICKWSSLARQTLPLLHNTVRGKVSGITAMKNCAESDCRSDQSDCRMCANSCTAHSKATTTMNTIITFYCSALASLTLWQPLGSREAAHQFGFCRREECKSTGTFELFMIWGHCLYLCTVLNCIS